LHLLLVFRFLTQCQHLPLSMSVCPCPAMSGCIPNTTNSSSTDCIDSCPFGISLCTTYVSVSQGETIPPVQHSSPLSRIISSPLFRFLGELDPECIEPTTHHCQPLSFWLLRMLAVGMPSSRSAVVSVNSRSFVYTPPSHACPPHTHALIPTCRSSPLLSSHVSVFTCVRYWISHRDFVWWLLAGIYTIS
jgi:hypothetical protein